jgi:phosphoglycolate phosphatase
MGRRREYYTGCFRIPPESDMRRLLLFDIDGTLVDCGPQVRPLLEAAMVEVFGTAGAIAACDFAGKTDAGIAHELLNEAGLPRETIVQGLPRLCASYIDRLESSLDRGKMRLLPGVEALLERLAKRSDVVLALLTGNWEAGARTKLSRFDLNRFFPFGAFGGDGVDRAELPPIAFERAFQATGERFAPAKTLIVGDSLNDIACARAHDIPVLAVATGRTPAATLQAAGADWVVADLPAAGEVLELFAE